MHHSEINGNLNIYEQVIMDESSLNTLHKATPCFIRSEETKSFENIVEKEENAGNQHFLL